MSAIKPNDSALAEEAGEETDWAAAKAFFDNLKTNKPRPVSNLLTSLSLESLCVSCKYFLAYTLGLHTC